MNNKFKFRFSKSRTSLMKYEPPPDPLEIEKRTQKMEPRQDWYNQRLVEYIREFGLEQKKGMRIPERPLPSNPPVSPYYRGNVNETLARYYSPSGTPQAPPPSPSPFYGETPDRGPSDQDLEDAVQQNLAYQDMLAKIKFKTWGENLTERARKEYTIDFIKWMMGTSEYNLDLKKTPWGRNKLVGPGIPEFIEGYIDKKTSYELAVQKMRAMIPSNIDEAWLYYKFVVSKPDLVSPQQTLSHGGKIDPDDYDWNFFPELDWWLKRQQGWAPAQSNANINPDQLPPEFEPMSFNASFPGESMNRYGNSNTLPPGVQSITGDFRGPVDQRYNSRGDPGPLDRKMEFRGTVTPTGGLYEPGSTPVRTFTAPNEPQMTPPSTSLPQDFNTKGTFMRETPPPSPPLRTSSPKTTPPSSPSYDVYTGSSASSAVMGNE